jgi:uncharacterized SAM-binding protein YcdF (DUF218 family)
VIDILLKPLVVILLLLVVLLVVLVRRRDRCGLAPILLCAAALLVLLSCSSMAVSGSALELLEADQHHLEPVRLAAPDAILVLGGGIRERRTERPVLSDGSKERMLEGVRLARAWPQTPLAFSGGNPTDRGETLADLMTFWAVQAGIEPERVVVEPRARTTRENVVNLAALARERGWTRLVVVTSASHMPRALAAFRAVGLDPLPAPCDFTDTGDSITRWILPDPDALRRTHAFLHEIVGHRWYAWKGWA